MHQTSPRIIELSFSLDHLLNDLAEYPYQKWCRLGMGFLTKVEFSTRMAKTDPDQWALVKAYTR
jgi:hypothetical protein